MALKPHPFRAPTGPAVKGLMLLLCVVFFAEAFNVPWAITTFGYQVGGAFWQPWTYGFLHASYIHIGINLMVLWMFGRAVEAQTGPWGFLVLYCGCVVAGAMTQMGAVYFGLEAPSIVIGASAGVAGILAAFVYYHPRARVMLLLPPIPMAAWVAGAAYLAVELGFLFAGFSTQVAHAAHVGGFACGLGACLIAEKGE